MCELTLEVVMKTKAHKVWKELWRQIRMAIKNGKPLSSIPASKHLIAYCRSCMHGILAVKPGSRLVVCALNGNGYHR